MMLCPFEAPTCIKDIGSIKSSWYMTTVRSTEVTQLRKSGSVPASSQQCVDLPGTVLHLPAATQRFVESNKGKIRIAVASRQLVFCRVERSLRIEYREKIFDALPVEPCRDVHRLTIRGHLGRKLLMPHFRLRIGYKGSLDVPKRVQHGPMVHGGG